MHITDFLNLQNLAHFLAAAVVSFVTGWALPSFVPHIVGALAKAWAKGHQAQIEAEVLKVLQAGAAKVEDVVAKRVTGSAIVAPATPIPSPGVPIVLSPEQWQLLAQAQAAGAASIAEKVATP